MFSILTVLENKVKINLCFARVNIERGPTISSHCVHFFMGGGGGGGIFLWDIFHGRKRSTLDYALAKLTLLELTLCEVLFFGGGGGGGCFFKDIFLF